jgi:hypothetical protein
MTGQLGVIYMLHFDRPYRHARHYVARRCPHGRDISCPTRHVGTDRRLGRPMCGDCYDYQAAVVFNDTLSWSCSSARTLPIATLPMHPFGLPSSAKNSLGSFPSAPQIQFPCMIFQ